MTLPPDTSPRPDDTHIDAIRRNLTWLRYWIPVTVGPLVAVPALDQLDEADQAVDDLEADRDRTTDLLLDATKGD